MDAILSLLFRGYEEELKIRRLRDRIAAEDNIALADKAKNIGWQIREKLARGVTADIEKYAVGILQLCEELTGKPIDRSEYHEIRRIFGTAISIKEHFKLINEIGYFLCSLSSPSQSARQALVLSEVFRNAKDTQKSVAT